MRTISSKVPAGVGAVLEIAVKGDYVRVRESDVDLIIENPDSGDKIEVSEGDDFELEPFKRLLIYNTSASEQPIKLTVSSGKRAGASRVGGSVSVNNSNGLFTQSRGNVTNAVNPLLAANANRRYLLIQNNDASTYLRVTVDGNDPTATAGFRIGPGDSFEVPAFCCTGAIKAMMETPSATVNNVEWCEG